MAGWVAAAGEPNFAKRLLPRRSHLKQAGYLVTAMLRAISLSFAESTQPLDIAAETGNGLTSGAMPLSFCGRESRGMAANEATRPHQGVGVRRLGGGCVKDNEEVGHFRGYESNADCAVLPENSYRPITPYALCRRGFLPLRWPIFPNFQLFPGFAGSCSRCRTRVLRGRPFHFFILRHVRHILAPTAAPRAK